MSWSCGLARAQNTWLWSYFFSRWTFPFIRFDWVLGLPAEGELRFPVRFPYAWINIPPRDGSPGVCLAGKAPNEFAGKQNSWPLQLVLLFLIERIFRIVTVPIFVLFCFAAVFFCFVFLLKRHGCVFWIVQVIFLNKRVKLFYTLDDGIKAVVWIWIFSLVLILPVPWTHHCIYSWDRISSWNNYEERRKYEERKGDLALRRVTHCLGVESALGLRRCVLVYSLSLLGCLKVAWCQ